MPTQNERRFPRVISFLDSLKRGRDRRRRKLSAALTPASESLEARTLLSAINPAIDLFEVPLTPTFTPAPGSEIGYVDSEPVFEFGSDVVINWHPEADSQDFDIRIYNVDTGQEVVNENHLSSAEFLPTVLTQSGRYQVFLRDTDINGQTGDWKFPRYFNLTGGEGELPTRPAQFIGVKYDPALVLEFEPAVVSGQYFVDYEVVIYNVAAGQEVYRSSFITGNSVPLDGLIGSSDEFQAFIRTSKTSDLYGSPNPVAGADADAGGVGTFDAVPIVSDWSDPFYFSFSGESESQVLPAATFNERTGAVEWEPVDGTGYEFVIYDVATGQEVIRRERPLLSNGGGPPHTDPFYVRSLGYPPGRYQAFYRILGNHHRPATLWSAPLEFEVPTTLPASLTNVVPPPVTVDPQSYAVEWIPTLGAVSYDMFVYNINTGQEVTRGTGITVPNIDMSRYPFEVPAGGDYDIPVYQVFYRARFANQTFSQWSLPVTYLPPVVGGQPLTL